eukprot:s123_g6.t1
MCGRSGFLLDGMPTDTDSAACCSIFTDFPPALWAAPGMEIQHMLMTPDVGLELRLQPMLALKQPGVR